MLEKNEIRKEDVVPTLPQIDEHNPKEDIEANNKIFLDKEYENPNKSKRFEDMTVRELLDWEEMTRIICRKAEDEFILADRTNSNTSRPYYETFLKYNMMHDHILREMKIRIETQLNEE